MKIISKNLKHGEIKILVENTDDLWFLTQLISQGDIVSGKTMRKIKIGGDEGDSVKKTFFVGLNVEKVDFQPDVVRIGGLIVSAPEDIPKGSHQSINIEKGTVLAISKKEWGSYQLKILEDAVKQKAARVLICVFDREDAFFALTKATGYEILSKMKGSVVKKAVETQVTGNFYQKVIQKLKEYNIKFQPSFIILASPAFWKEELLAQLKDADLREKIIQATCASSDEKAINEVLKRDEVKTALHEERAMQELNLVEKLLSEISKGGLAVYGFANVCIAAECKAVSVLLVSTELIKKKQEEGTFEDVNNIMKVVDRSKGAVHIISSEHDGGKQLDGLGGIAAILRFKITT